MPKTDTEDRQKERVPLRTTRRRSNSSAAPPTPAFDHARLVAALAATPGHQVDPESLPLMAIELAGNTVELDAFGEHWRCHLDGNACEQTSCPHPAPMPLPLEFFLAWLSVGVLC